MDNRILQTKRDIIEAGHLLSQKKLIARTWGNISARISENQFLITPSGRPYRTLTEHDIVTVNISDLSYQGDVRPSSEAGVHAELYRLRPDTGAVIHTHQNMASAISVSPDGLQIDNADYQALLGDVVPCTAYGMPGTKKLRTAVKDAAVRYPDSRAFLLPRHGTVIESADLDTAFAAAKALECAAEKKYRHIVKDEFPDSQQEKSGPPEKARKLCAVIRRVCGVKYIMYADSEAVTAFSKKGIKLKPWLDDLSQIAGVNIGCFDLSDSRSLIRELRHKNAVFIKGYGAVCTGSTPEDASAVKMILEKGCMAALYGMHVSGARPLSMPDALLQRFIYQHKYSKKSLCR